VTARLGEQYSGMCILRVPERASRIEEDVVELQFEDAKNVPYLSLGSSQTAVEGQRVLVIGNPEGLTETVSDGIIAAFRKNQAIIQITAPVSPGSSGSPVLDESGKVIGIATSSSQQGQNLNFAISVDAVRDDIGKNLPSKDFVQKVVNRA
jgi:serine protease Do